MARLRGISVRCVSGQVANPASAHSSRTVDTTSPQGTESSAASLSHDSTRITDRSAVVSLRCHVWGTGGLS